MSVVRRLFHSILNLKRVIVSSAHWLALKDKQMFNHDPSNLFLQMVSTKHAQFPLPPSITANVINGSKALFFLPISFSLFLIFLCWAWFIGVWNCSVYLCAFWKTVITFLHLALFRDFVCLFKQFHWVCCESWLLFWLHFLLTQSLHNPSAPNYNAPYNALPMSSQVWECRAVTLQYAHLHW